MESMPVSKITINNFSSKAIEGMLHWMYIGTILDKKLATELFKIADRFQVALLKNKAESLIVEQVEEFNALEVFHIGKTLGSDKIKQATFSVIKTMFQGRKFPDELIDRPESLKIIVEAYRKIKETNEKIDEELLQLSKKKKKTD
jgi:hypothetical protein